MLFVSQLLPRDDMQSAVLPWQVVGPSVCPSVRLSVRLRYPVHKDWNSSKIISRLISPTFSVFTPCRPHHHGSNPKGTPLNFSRVGKIVDFQHLSRRISETVQDGLQVAIDH